MSTTVIASRHGNPGLYLAPWLSGAVNEPAVRRIAAEHGVDLFDAGRLNTQTEVIVAAGLDPARAARLAGGLREEGLTVRVVNDPTITQSMRIGNALTLLFLAAVVTSPLVMPALLAVVNALYIAVGGLSLQVIGAPDVRPPDAVRALERLRALHDQLPAHVLDPILAKATVLAEEAAADAGGPAERALRELLVDLEEDREVQVTDTARSLRQELQLARRAARELQ
jgi:hypothetical protein